MIRRFVVILLILCTLPLAAKNRLGAEKSPYLVAHAGNLVDWAPWGAEAFARARKEDKPIFLSIGYASCHWCHVMSRESFDNPEIAQLLNSYFVAVLVDRQEHPDVDATYLSFVQATTGSAGWPANLILGSDLQPLLGASYMKPEALNRLLTVVSNRWTKDRKAFLASASLVGVMIEQPSPANVEAKETFARAIDELQQSFDAKNGGFGSEPKFPQASTLDFLLRSGNAPARDMALKTLRAMAVGSIHDQIGGGFHRYATDAAWREPHFEKMLSDQALLAIDYLEAWQQTREPLFESVARDTLDYILELRLPGGGFASGADADSLIPGKNGPELVEGVFYFWSPEQLAFLGKRDADIAAYYFGIDKPGSLPYTAHSLSFTRQKFGGTEEEFAATMTSIRARMNELRGKRPEPFFDAKIIAGWNGLAISALARGGAAFGEPRYIRGATEAAKVIRTKLWNKKLFRVEGIDAVCEDYAYTISAMLDLFEATGDVSLLEFAVTLQTKQDALFWNETAFKYENGGAVPKLLAGLAVESESALPTANSVAAANLLRLGEFTDSAAWRDRPSTIFHGYGSRLQNAPSELPAMLAAMTMMISAPRQIVIAGNPGADDTRTLMRIAHEHFMPLRIIVPAYGGTSQQRLAAYMPIVKEMKPIDKKATAYVCEHYVCKLPTSDPVQLTKSLEMP
jgi:uncharacterized protein YyaL (SSP411 family)